MSYDWWNPFSWGGDSVDTSNTTAGPVISGDDYGKYLESPRAQPAPTSSFDIPYADIIKAGAGLAGTYYTLQGNKQMNDAQIQAAKDKLAAELALAGKGKGGGGGGGGGAGNAMAIARMGNLSQLYQNWGQLAEKAGENQAQAAQATGKLAIDPIIARLAALR